MDVLGILKGRKQSETKNPPRPRSALRVPGWEKRPSPRRNCSGSSARPRPAPQTASGHIEEGVEVPQLGVRC